MKLKRHEIADLKEAVIEELIEQRKKPLVVSIMGQTGVGKSTLIYSLFNLDYKNESLRPNIQNSVHPVTKQVETYHVSGLQGFPLIIHDMPGIGESEETDRATLLQYRDHFLHSDVVLWAIHVDNRSITFDAQALRTMLSDITTEQRSALMSKLTFVLTKVDVLQPVPWVMGYKGKQAVFLPGKDTQAILDAKEEYYQERLIAPFGQDIDAWTYNDVNFMLNDPAFSYNEFKVSYRGLLTKKLARGYARRYPQFAPVFERLYDNYRVIPCSALFKYHLDQLLIVILNKLDPSSIENFKQQIDFDAINQVPWQEAKKLCNIRIFDFARSRTVFDLSSGTFPRMRERLSLRS